MFRKSDILHISKSECSDSKFYIPKRYIFTILAFFGVVNAYAMRANLGIAIVAMVSNDTNFTDHVIMHDESNQLNQRNRTPKTVYEVPKYNWDMKSRGLILSSFFYGYLFLQIPGGLVAEKLGAKWVGGSGVLIPSALYILTPFAASCNFYVLLGSQALQGLAQGIMFPSLNILISRWSPVMERSRITSFIMSGVGVGTVMTMAVSGILCSSDLFGGWPATFYLYGTTGCIWFLLWSIFAYESPSDHPNISAEELSLTEETGCQVTRKKCETPWAKIFTSSPVWAFIVGKIGKEFGFILFITLIPTYISDVLHYSVEMDGFLTAAIHLACTVFLLVTSYFADKLRKSNRMNITNIRKLFASIGLLGPAVCLLCVTILGFQPEVIIVLLILGMLLNGSCIPGVTTIHLDMCPDFAGIVYAVANVISSGCSATHPIIVGIFTQSGATLRNWNKVFYLTSAVYIICAIYFDVFASAEPQAWGLIHNRTDPTNLKNIQEKKVDNPEKRETCVSV